MQTSHLQTVDTLVVLRFKKELLGDFGKSVQHTVVYEDILGQGATTYLGNPTPLCEKMIVERKHSVCIYSMCT